MQVLNRIRTLISALLDERNPLVAHARFTLEIEVGGVSFCELFLLGRVGKGISSRKRER